MSEYKDGRGDFFLADGLREERITALKDALSWADFGKNDAGFDNGQPEKNVRLLIERLEQLGYRVQRSASVLPSESSSESPPRGPA